MHMGEERGSEKPSERDARRREEEGLNWTDRWIHGTRSRRGDRIAAEKVRMLLVLLVSAT